MPCRGTQAWSKTGLLQSPNQGAALLSEVMSEPTLRGCTSQPAAGMWVRGCAAPARQIPAGFGLGRLLGSFISSRHDHV